MKYKPLALAAAALVAGYLSYGAAQAANVMTGASAMPGVEKTQNTNIQQAKHRKGFRRWRGGNRHWGHRYRRFGGSGIFLGLGLAPFYGSYYEPYYAEPYYYVPPSSSRHSRHVRYCLNRYLTYHIPSNTFRGFDGDRHRCRSPYRY